MEGVPRVPMLAPELRIPDALPDQFVSKIKQYIAYHYQDDPEKFNEAFSELASLRLSLSRGIPDIENLCIMKRYFAQLIMMKKRFPMEQNDPIAIPFSWADRTSDIPTSLVFEDVNFELCSIMYNIGAMHGQIAAVETRSDLDSIKNSFMHFQYAAWPLQQLRDSMNAARFGSNDFQASILTFYLNVLLAQAQECMLEKSMIDHRKPTVIAKIAIHLAALYSQCNEHLEGSDVSDHISSNRFKQWTRLCSVKSELYAAIANFYMGVYSEDEKNYGLRLAYMAVALDHIKKATELVKKDKQESLKQSVAFASDVIVQKEANARKENDFIYHERVPKPDDLPKIEGVVLVKPQGFDPCDRSIAGDDLFAALLPSNVIKAVSMYSEEKANFKRKIIAKVDQKNEQLMDYLNTLQLHRINLDQSDEHLRLPDELLRSSAAFVAQPDAIPELLDKFDKVAKLSNDAESKLTDLKNRLSTITHSSLTSDEGYQAITKKLEELNGHHVKARTNNTELQKALATHSEYLKLLAMPLTELAKEVCGEPIKIGETEEGTQLKKLLDKVDEMQKQRIRLTKDLEHDLDNDDITSKALVERDLDGQRLFDRELNKHNKAVELVEMNLSAQDNILQALTEANANFASLRKQIDQSTEHRNQKALALVTAYEVYEDIKAKTEKALNFYSQLFTILSTLEKATTNMEDVFAKLNKEEEDKKKKAEEEKATNMMQASLKEDFPNLPVHSPAPLPPGEMRHVPPISTPDASSTSKQRRPKLGDYMEFYRNKMSGGSPRPQASVPASMQPQQPQPQFPNAPVQPPSSSFVPPQPSPSQFPPSSQQPTSSFPEEQFMHQMPVGPSSRPNLPPTSVNQSYSGNPNMTQNGQPQILPQMQRPSIPSQFPSSTPQVQPQHPIYNIPNQVPSNVSHPHAHPSVGQMPSNQATYSSAVPTQAQFIQQQHPSVAPASMIPNASVQRPIPPQPSMSSVQTPPQSAGISQPYAPSPLAQRVQPMHQIPQDSYGRMSIQVVQVPMPTPHVDQCYVPVSVSNVPPQQNLVSGPIPSINQAYTEQRMSTSQNTGTAMPHQQVQQPMLVQPQHVQPQMPSTVVQQGPCPIPQSIQQPMQSQHQPIQHQMLSNVVNMNQPRPQQPYTPASSHPGLALANVTVSVHTPVPAQPPAPASVHPLLSVPASTPAPAQAPMQNVQPSNVSYIPPQLQGAPKPTVSTVPTSATSARPTLQNPQAPTQNIPQSQAQFAGQAAPSQMISPWHRNVPTSAYNVPHQQQTIPQVQQIQRNINTPASPFQPIQPAPAQTAVHYNTIQAPNTPAQQQPLSSTGVPQVQSLGNQPTVQQPMPIQPSMNQSQPRVVQQNSQNISVKNSNLDLLSELFDDQLSAAPVLAPSPIVTKQQNVGSTPPDEKTAILSKFQNLSRNDSSSSVNSQRSTQTPVTSNAFKANMAPENEPKVEKSTYIALLNSPRPAATVLPIVQPTAIQPNPSSMNGNDINSCLSMTNVSSVSHVGENSQNALNVSPPRPSGSQAHSSENKISSLLDPNTFEIGESDEIKLQKRQLREQFKNYGTAAQLPKLDTNDPLNQIDPKTWFSKN